MNDSYAQVPGSAGRWTLTSDESGLTSMAAMYSTVNKLANDMTLYTTLQGITMQLLIIRLIRVLSAQKRLSILTTTAIKVGARNDLLRCSNLPALTKILTLLVDAVRLRIKRDTSGCALYSTVDCIDVCNRLQPRSCNTDLHPPSQWRVCTPDDCL